MFDLTKMRLQTMFNKAYKGLASQGFERCVNSQGHCKYSAKGMHCAVGWIVPLHANTNGDVNTIARRGYIKITNDQETFLSELQQAHDNGIDDVRFQMEAVAMEYGLTIPKVK